MHNTPEIAIHNQVPRLRFSEFNGIDDFELVSDNNCISPMYGISSTEIHEGLVINFKNDVFTIDLNNGGEIIKYTIPEYGVM